jgi:hypothetical protein
MREKIKQNSYLRKIKILILKYVRKIFKTPKILLAILGILGFGFYVGVMASYASYNPKNVNSEFLGQVGDFFGGFLNPLFAFLSFVALLITIAIQSEELEMTRKELAKSAKAQKQSSEIFRQQRFENTFFSLLDTINSTISIFNKEKEVIYNKCKNDDSYLTADRDRDVNIKFSKVSILIYQLLKLINNYEVSQEAKKQYSNILRACIKDDLLRLLAEHCKNKDESFDAYVALIRKYAFFEHMQTNPGKDILNHYGDEAFGKNIYLEEWKK